MVSSKEAYRREHPIHSSNNICLNMTKVGWEDTLNPSLFVILYIANVIYKGLKWLISKNLYRQNINVLNVGTSYY